MTRSFNEGLEVAAREAESIGNFHLSASEMSLPVEPSRIIARDRANVAKRIAEAIRSLKQKEAPEAPDSCCENLTSVISEN